MNLALQGQDKDLEETLKILNNLGKDIEHKPLIGSARVSDRHLRSYQTVVHRLPHHLNIILRLEVARKVVYEHHRYLVVATQTLLECSRSKPTHPVHNRSRLILQVHSRILPYTGVGWVTISSCLFFGALAQKTLNNISLFVKQYGISSKYRVMILRERS